MAPKTDAKKYDVTETTYIKDAAGNIVGTKTRTPKAEPVKEKPVTIEGYGLTQSFLTAYPEMQQLFARALADQKAGKTWEAAKWKMEYDKTKYAQERTAAEESFDSGITDPNLAPDYQRKIDDTYVALKKQVSASGVAIDDAEIQDFAKQTVRKNLTVNDAVAFIAKKYQQPTGAAAASAQAKPAVGAVANIGDAVKKMALSYGLNPDASYIQAKIKDGLEQGDNWQTWLEGQRGVFREQAKITNPKIAEKLDQFTLEDLLDPYMATAESMLGVPRTSMTTSDPIWSVALNGPNGPMTVDEWERTIKTDARYGWDRTKKARNEFSNLADELLSVFGMA